MLDPPGAAATTQIRMKDNLGSIMELFLQFQNKKQHVVERQERRQRRELEAQIWLTSGGLAKRVELFGEYVVRHLGVNSDTPVAKHLAEVAMGYLVGDKSHSDLSLEDILLFLSRVCRNLSDEEMLFLNRELAKELDACMISYFAFHWHHSAHLLDQVRDGERKLKNIVMAATRKHRFQRTMDTLKTKRAFSTLLETLRAMSKRDAAIPSDGNVVVPADSTVRSPVLLLIGGGMGAGKSTVVKEILNGSSFWSGVVHNAVLVEADAFKEADVVYRAISSMGHGDIAMASQVVHQFSTKAASSLLVSALNEGRDVVFDGTMMWAPFVLQTIAMARDVHRRRYRMGRGYEAGGVVEEYWEPVEEDPSRNMKPYRIELVGVTCDPLLAVVRGIRRAIITKRAVPITGQLRSHKLFAASLETYCELVDHAKIYSTSRMGGSPELIAWKDGNSKLLVDAEAFKGVKEIAQLNLEAGSILELFGDGYDYESHGVWKEIVLAPERGPRLEFLKKMLTSSSPEPEDSSLLQHSSSSEAEDEISEDGGGGISILSNSSSFSSYTSDLSPQSSGVSTLESELSRQSLAFSTSESDLSRQSSAFSTSESDLSRQSSVLSRQSSSPYSLSSGSLDIGALPYEVLELA